MGKGQPDKKGGQKRPAEEEAGPSKGAGSSSDKGLPTLDASPLEFLIAPLVCRAAGSQRACVRSSWQLGWPDAHPARLLHCASHATVLLL